MPPSRDQNNDPKNPFSKKPEGGSSNWGIWIVVAIMAGVLFIGFTSPGAFGFGSKKETLVEFQSSYKNGTVVLNEQEKAPITVLMSDSSPDAYIVAFKYKDGTKCTVTREPFTLVFNANLADDQFKKRLDELGVVQPSDKEMLAGPRVGNISTDRFDRLVAEGRIEGNNGQKPRLYYDGGTGILVGDIVTRTWPPIGGKDGALVEKVEVPFNLNFDGPRVRELLGDTALYRTETSTWKTILFNLLPILLIIGILFFMFRVQSGGGGARNAMNFGKSRAKLMAPEKQRVTFKDVAGVSEAKEEVSELVDYLRTPQKFRDLGGNIPKGVLMVGPPGTGKTLLARAIAGEAEVPFFSISGSDFVEMFVGVGASRVRDMFEQAKKSSPCIIFIDEIDAVGRHRGYGVGGGHDEREQTLNALLVEMDGFDGNESVIVIAATNRADVLDPALLRPGRFDRQVEVGLPDVKGREQILLVHAKKVKMADDADFGPIARGTAGFSGAELANLINEAALLAARKGVKKVGNAELEEARDKVRWGRERRSLSISDKEKRITAVHEGGHAICLLKTEKSEPLHKVTIIPRGPALGSTMWLPAEDKYHMLRSEMLDSLVVAMGGRCAEQIVFEDVTSGAVGDIRMATKMARRMVCEFGMSDKLGLVEYGSQSGEVFLARDLGTNSRNYSEKTAEIIDQEVKEYVDHAYSRARAILTENRDKLDLLTEALLEYETLDGLQVREILENGFMSNPPQKEEPPPMPDDDSDDTDPKKLEQDTAEDTPAEEAGEGGEEQPPRL